ncbi:MAG: M16 family metallopeptidase [Hyphomicrobiaceae bacterium]
MSVEVTELANGLRVVSTKMAHVHSVSIGVWVGIGARDEAESEHGICHLLEHMAFKGTQTRSARQIAEEIEDVGGDMNAATGLEMTAYYVRVLKEDVRLGLTLLADIIQNAIIDPDELVLEKDVILQEIAGIEDAPDEIAYDLALDAAFAGQSLGRTVIGTPSSVLSLQADDLHRHLAQRYTSRNMVIAGAGAVDHDTFVNCVQDLFSDIKSCDVQDSEISRFVGGVRHSKKSFEQCHLVVGFPGRSYRDSGFMESQVFSSLFGGGMSSRLFQEAREKRGICYSIYSSAWGLRDGGLFSIHAATGKNMVKDLTAVVADELRKCADGGVTDQEIGRAKAQLRAGLLMSLESPSARAEQAARQILTVGKPIEIDDLLKRVDEVSNEGLCSFAANLLAASTPAIAVVGANNRSGRMAEQIGQLFVAQ